MKNANSQCRQHGILPRSWKVRLSTCEVGLGGNSFPTRYPYPRSRQPRPRSHEAIGTQTAFLRHATSAARWAPGRLVKHGGAPGCECETPGRYRQSRPKITPGDIRGFSCISRHFRSLGPKAATHARAEHDNDYDLLPRPLVDFQSRYFQMRLVRIRIIIAFLVDYIHSFLFCPALVGTVIDIRQIRNRSKSDHRLCVSHKPETSQTLNEEYVKWRRL